MKEETEQLLTEEEVKKLALDLMAGKVFHDRILSSPSDIALVFLPLALMDREGLLRLQAKGPCLIYEYLDCAEERSVNGLPVFMSFRYLTQPNFIRVVKMIERLEKAVAEIKEEIK